MVEVIKEDSFAKSDIRCVRIGVKTYPFYFFRERLW